MLSICFVFIAAVFEYKLCNCFQCCAWSSEIGYARETDRAVGWSDTVPVRRFVPWDSLCLLTITNIFLTIVIRIVALTYAQFCYVVRVDSEPQIFSPSIFAQFNYCFALFSLLFLKSKPSNQSLVINLEINRIYCNSANLSPQIDTQI